MSTAPNQPDAPYSRVNYRRLVAWETRITREGPFLRSLRDQAPDRSVVNLGCGIGEQVAFFATERTQAIRLDRSEPMVSVGKDDKKAAPDVDRTPSARHEESRYWAKEERQRDGMPRLPAWALYVGQGS